MGIQTNCQVIGRSNLQRHLRKINILCPPFRIAPTRDDRMSIAFTSGLLSCLRVVMLSCLRVGIA